MTRSEKIKQLEIYFLENLVEDPQNGTDFDCDVLDNLKELQEYWRDHDSAKN